MCEGLNIFSNYISNVRLSPNFLKDSNVPYIILFSNSYAATHKQLRLIHVFDFNSCIIHVLTKYCSLHQKNHYLIIAIYFNLFCTKYILYLCFCFCERKDFITCCYNKMLGLKLVIFIRKELLCPVFITPQVCSSFYSIIYSLIKLRVILFLISSFFRTNEMLRYPWWRQLGHLV